MACNRVRRAVFLWVDRDREELPRASMERHLEGCPHCRERAHADRTGHRDGTHPMLPPFGSDRAAGENQGFAGTGVNPMRWDRFSTRRAAAGRPKWAAFWVALPLLLALSALPGSPAGARQGGALPGLAGGQLASADLAQGTHIVVIWASWSPRCRDIAPRVDRTRPEVRRPGPRRHRQLPGGGPGGRGLRASAPLRRPGLPRPGR